MSAWAAKKAAAAPCWRTCRGGSASSDGLDPFGRARSRALGCPARGYSTSEEDSHASLKYSDICRRIVEFRGPLSCWTAIGKNWKSWSLGLKNLLHQLPLWALCEISTSLKPSTSLGNTPLLPRAFSPSAFHRTTKIHFTYLSLWTYLLCSCLPGCTWLAYRPCTGFYEFCPPSNCPRTWLCRRTADCGGSNV